MLCGGFWLWTWRISGEYIAKKLEVRKGKKLELFSIRGQYFESDQLKILISFILGFNDDNWDFLGSKCILKHSITNLIIKNFASSNMKKKTSARSIIYKLKNVLIVASTFPLTQCYIQCLTVNVHLDKKKSREVFDSSNLF